MIFPVYLDAISAIILAISFAVAILAAFEFGAACMRGKLRRLRQWENHWRLVEESRKARKKHR